MLECIVDGQLHTHSFPVRLHHMVFHLTAVQVAQVLRHLHLRVQQVTSHQLQRKVIGKSLAHHRIEGDHPLLYDLIVVEIIPVVCILGAAQGIDPVGGVVTRE